MAEGRWRTANRQAMLSVRCLSRRFSVAEGMVHIHDLQATILHLLGLEHTRLTFRFQGRDFRLTDIAGNVVREILA